MKLLVAFAIIAAATAAVIPQSEYLPPVEAEAAAPLEEISFDSAPLADDGYRYKTVRKLKYRNRRDVSELAPEYLPPVEEAAPAQDAPVDGYQYNTPAAEEPQQDTAILADDGYQYKTVRRLKYRHRRDVSELAPEYLPPVEEAAPAQDAPVDGYQYNTPAAEEPQQDTAILADDGYQYKTVRRLKYRHRRDVSELAPEYLPPAEQASPEYLPPVDKVAPLDVEPEQDSAVLADDGYQYKTVRRLKYRQRRDVSEIAAAPEYLPPVEESAPLAVEPEQDSAVLADDGYQYKTVRRLKYRQRRDVSEIAAPEYLPPVEESAPLAVEPEQDSAVLADDGYQYKTVRRLKYRQRRDVSEIAAAPEYLPPVEESAPLAVEPEQDSAVLADDGYQYKTVRRLKYRQRRDVSEIAAAPEYLPPVEESAPLAAEPEQDSAVLADDGYQYKTVRRLKYRQRRDVSEIAPEYLPPVDEAPLALESAVLADDGYQYKQIKKLKYKHRV